MKSLVMLMLATPLCCGAVNLSTWMGDLQPLIGGKTLLDLSVPGTHDTMTYDLSYYISDDAEGMSPGLAGLLHTASKWLPSPAAFVRAQSITQSSSIIDQLNGGVRFIDFRIVFTRGPQSLVGHKDWYNLHMMESNSKCLTYLQEIKTWMDEHPKEILTFWWTKHGNCESGQFANVTDEETQTFFNQTEAVFGDMIWDTSVSKANETTISTLIERNHRVLLYVAESNRFFGNRSKGYDACNVNNQLGDGVTKLNISINQDLASFATAQDTINQDKRVLKYSLRSMASGGISEQIVGAAKIKYLSDEHAAKKCAAAYNIPNLTDWCPPTLLSQARIANYYDQIALETSILLQQQNATQSRFPNAIYIDDVNATGVILTGYSESNATMLTGLNDPNATAIPLEGLHDDANTAGYAYSATVILSNVLTLCHEQSFTQCAGLVADLTALREAHPFHTVNDSEHGRLVGWPFGLPTVGQ